MSYSNQQQQMAVPNPPQPPMQHPNHPSQHGSHPMGAGGQQQGGPSGGPLSQQNQSNASYNQQQHSYQEGAKPKKGQQLWNRMKRELLWGREGALQVKTPGPLGRWRPLIGPGAKLLSIFFSLAEFGWILLLLQNVFSFWNCSSWFSVYILPKPQKQTHQLASGN